MTVRIEVGAVYRIVKLYLLPFFFQAEDGIRDDLVTGVQTCALPISRAMPASGCKRAPRTAGSRRRPTTRSEERRVGKECRSRWAADHYKKKVVEAAEQSELAISVELGPETNEVAAVVAHIDRIDAEL